MLEMVVIADDFTGANDTGVQLVKGGLKTSVLLDTAALTGAEQAVVIDTESRVLSESTAGERVATAVQATLAAGGTRLLYKKIDSTLRGHLTQEIRACIAEYRPTAVVLAPAYPAQGRTVVGGRLMVRGTPLLTTEIARDPRNPLTEDNIVTLLAGCIAGTALADCPVTPVTLDDLQSEEFASGAFTAGVYACDSECAEDLDIIARRAIRSSERVLYIGSAGLAEALFSECGSPATDAPPALAIVGSISSSTMAQIAYARAQGTAVVHVDMARVLDGDGLASYARQAREWLAGGTSVIVTATETRADYESFVAYGLCRGRTVGELAELTKRTLAALAPEIIDGLELAGVFLTGGDTAIAVIEALGATGSAIERELLPGFVAGRLIGGAAAGLPIVTKAGAFGTEKDIYRSLSELQRL